MKRLSFDACVGHRNTQAQDLIHEVYDGNKWKEQNRASPCCIDGECESGGGDAGGICSPGMAAACHGSIAEGDPFGQLRAVAAGGDRGIR